MYLEAIVFFVAINRIDARVCRQSRQGLLEVLLVPLVSHKHFDEEGLLYNRYAD